MATNVKYARKIDREKSNLWAISSLGSVGIGYGPVGVGAQLFHLVNRNTHRGHRFELITGGGGIGPPVTGSIGSSDYVSFRTQIPVDFFDFDGKFMRVGEVNIGVYSWTAVEIPSLLIKVSISDSGLGVPQAGDSGGRIGILFGDGQIMGQIDDLQIKTNFENYSGPKPFKNMSNDEALTYLLPGDLLFGFNKTFLKPGRRTDEALERVLNQMNYAGDDFRFLIVGHTDNIGAPDYNLQLSRKRAETVANWFKANNIRHPEWIKTAGMGLTEPIKPNDSDDNRQQNRRVEVVVIRKKYWDSW